MKPKTFCWLRRWGTGLALVIAVIGFAGCTSGPFASDLNHSPTSAPTTWRGDNHTQPVFTSPAASPGK